MEIYKNLSPELQHYTFNFLQSKEPFNRVLNQLDQFNIIKFQHDLNNYNFLKLLKKEDIIFSPTQYFYNSLLCTAQLTDIFNTKYFYCSDCDGLNYNFLLNGVGLRNFIPDYNRLHQRLSDVEIYYTHNENKKFPQAYILSELPTEPDSDSDFTDSDDSDYCECTDPEISDLTDSESDLTDTESDSDTEDPYNPFPLPNPNLNSYFSSKNGIL